MDTLRTKRFRAESSAQMSNRNNLSCGMRMVFFGRRMRVHNHHPVHNMNVGKQSDAYLIR